ncbi:hypothetical protein TL16_g02563 [Triparma laevis f. inornata]|uniref:Protein-serine/threonine kinase n=1 Tax=Triparma laevis f. inornata TaxID=1714386 RepID=A0A9W6ZRW6_9STRA|nr:hypothetical protein TL16_g02563 [Triparma laevis f. inornata]
MVPLCALRAPSRSFAGSSLKYQDLAKLRPTPLSLKNMYLYALSGSSKTGDTDSIDNRQRIRNAVFLQRELPIRIAQRAVDLESLPYGLARTPPVRRICHIYREYVETLTGLKSPSDTQSEEEFTNILKSQVLDRSTIPNSINEGLNSLKDDRREVLTPRSLKMMDQALYAFFLARVGLRFLTEHHIACEPRSREMGVNGGLIDNKCDPVKETKSCIESVRESCLDKFGVAPEIELVPIYPNEEQTTMTYVPTHLRYMISELLLNSAEATIKHHHVPEEESPTAGALNAVKANERSKLPPIRIIVAVGAEDVSIKIGDQGGGVARSDMGQIWTFAASTLAKEETMKSNDNVEQNIRGFGLPLARIYARYFGGELTLKSMEGYGVDTYLHLPVLGTDCENLPDAVENSPGNTDSMENDEGEQSWANLLKNQL